MNSKQPGRILNKTAYVLVNYFSIAINSNLCYVNNYLTRPVPKNVNLFYINLGVEQETYTCIISSN